MSKGERVAMLAVAVNVFMFGFKYVLAHYSGSMALRAEAFHSLLDVVASSTVLGGLLIANRKTRMFPYGLYKIENLVSVFVAILILFAGYEIVLGAFSGGTGEIRYSGIAIGGVLLMVVIAYTFSRYERKVGLEMNSPSLVADAEHIRVDLLANLIVVAALLANYIQIDFDRVATILIAGFIVWAGGKILIDAVRVLLDASLDHETLSEAEKLIVCEPQIMGIKSITGRNSGRYKFIEATIVVNTNDLDKAHFIITRIENKIKDAIKNVDRVLIHYEPVQKKNLVLAIPLENTEGNEISSHFGEAPFFLLVFVDRESKIILQTETVANPFSVAEHGKGILAAEMLNKHHIDILFLKNNFGGKGPLYVFSDAGVEIKLTDKEMVNEALKEEGYLTDS
ncbi:MAG: cation diffusion facilitator family transporter [Desulfitobacteriaceae bacterium]|nr:cation diffusion facilitator family transporter [Desulfitobacteriaceae bacterium]MDD4751908.1 cation diffusion facilitator family transporter [Desulfitobacteriaceae bacterium]